MRAKIDVDRDQLNTLYQFDSPSPHASHARSSIHRLTISSISKSAKPEECVQDRNQTSNEGADRPAVFVQLLNAAHCFVEFNVSKWIP